MIRVTQNEKDFYEKTDLIKSYNNLIARNTAQMEWYRDKVIPRVKRDIENSDNPVFEKLHSAQQIFGDLVYTLHELNQWKKKAELEIELLKLKIKEEELERGE